jgi:hypothetical protein
MWVEGGGGAARGCCTRHHPTSTVPAAQESTGITTIDEMVAAFVTSEDRNYAVLTMINDLNQVGRGMCVVCGVWCVTATTPSSP